MLNTRELNQYEWVYLTFALDSLLKIQMGSFRLHLGVIMVLLILYKQLRRMPKSDLRVFAQGYWSWFPYVLLIVVHVALYKWYAGTVTMALYFCLGAAGLIFAFFSRNHITCRGAVAFQWVLICSGLFQYTLYKVFNYQISFIDAQHYELGAETFATRMRGFFLEPNWYSISLGFNTLLVVYLNEKGIVKKKVLLLFSILCLVLNGSFTFIGVVTLVLMFRLIIEVRRLSWTRIAMVVCVVGMLGGLFYQRQMEDVDSIAVINHGSRLLPLLNVIDYMSDMTFERNLFGYGLGSWPYIGIQNELGYIGMAREWVVAPTRRDSAEVQVMILEFGYVGLFLVLLDSIVSFFRFRKNLVVSCAVAFIGLCYFVYPIYMFSMYLIPYYYLRGKAEADYCAK